ncbi:hypothetical protein K8I61_08780 [bacterium]|nr:hypothetical protein [bacterium]
MGAVLGAEYVLDKLSVLALLTGGYPVYTAFSDAAGTVKKGDPLHRVFSDENIFLSRNPRERARDDVGMLPEF